MNKEMLDTILKDMEIPGYQAELDPEVADKYFPKETAMSIEDAIDAVFDTEA